MIYLGQGNKKGRIKTDSQVSANCFVVVLTKLENPEGTGLGGKCFQCVQE